MKDTTKNSIANISPGRISPLSFVGDLRAFKFLEAEYLIESMPELCSPKVHARLSPVDVFGPAEYFMDGSIFVGIHTSGFIEISCRWIDGMDFLDICGMEIFCSGRNAARTYDLEASPCEWVSGGYVHKFPPDMFGGEGWDLDEFFELPQMCDG